MMQVGRIWGMALRDLSKPGSLGAAANGVAFKYQ